MKNVKTARAVERPKFSSRVDIVIPFHGQYDRVARLIESIFRYTLSNVYHIILVDDGSLNGTFLESLKKVRGIDCVRLDEQKGFGAAMKAGFERSEELNAERKKQELPEHAYVAFVQSDCLVEDIGWLRGLGECLIDHKGDGVRMVGATTNNPMTGDPRQRHQRDGEEDIILDKTCLGMHCFLVHRELFDHVGGFFKEYPYGNYEDEEFAYRLRKYGYKQAIALRSYVRHAGGATIRDVWRRDPKIQKIMEEDNRQRCVEDIKKI